MGSGNIRAGNIEFDLDVFGDNILVYVGGDTPQILRARTICHFAQVCPIPQDDSRTRIHSSRRTTGMGAVPKNGRRLRDIYGK